MTSKTVPIHSLLSYPSVICAAANVCLCFTSTFGCSDRTIRGLQVVTEWLTRTSAPPFAGLSRIRVGVALHIRWETHSALCLLQASLAFPVCWQHTSSPSRLWTCERGKTLFANTSGFLHLKRHGWSSQNNIGGAQTLLHIVSHSMTLTCNILSSNKQSQECPCQMSASYANNMFKDSRLIMK